MKVNQKGIDLVKRFEGLRLAAYIDPVGILTVGYGHTGRDVKPDQVISHQRAEDLLKADLEHAAKGVRRKLQNELNENQFSAVTSFTYNVGIGSLSRSTLLKKLNQSDIRGAAREFKKWVKGTIDGKKVRLPGLVRRRERERELFEEPVGGGAIILAVAEERPAEEAFFYIVRPGDLLAEIAQNNGLTVEILLSWNPHIADPNLIHPGDLLQFHGAPPHVAEPAADLAPEGNAPWYEIAKSEVGVAEVGGKSRNNARILEYHQSTSLSKNLARYDETPWCSSFANWCMQNAGIKGTRSAMARSWLKWGKALDEPENGCIVVFARPKAGPKSGHVGFYAGKHGDRIRVLGGNQSNSVKISSYSRDQLLGFRWAGSVPKTIKPIEDKAEGDRSYYLVQPGDSLAAIAERNGLSLDQVMAWNPQISRPNRIFPGDLILLVDAEPKAADPVQLPAGTEAPWFALAERELGVKERKGSHSNNNRILEYHRSTDLSENLARIDETPWCSSFVNWCVTQAGLEGTASARARSWSKWGKKLRKPRPGCIVVLSRPSAGPKAGHVGFYAGETATRIKLLGGNQSNRVRISNYDKKRIISFRWPDKLPSGDEIHRRRPLLSGLRILGSRIAAFGKRRSK